MSVSMPAYRTALIELVRPLQVWKPPQGGRTSLFTNRPKQPKPFIIADETKLFEPSDRQRSTRSFEDSQGGLSKVQQWQLDQTVLADWMDRQANPDDYDPEVSSCEECGEAIWFDVTTSGTLKMSCRRCGWQEGGAIYATSRHVAGAFGTPSPLKQRRRFWSGVGSFSTAGRGFRNAPTRRFVLPELVPQIIRQVPVNAKYNSGGSKYSEIIDFAAKGEPFIVPVPPDMKPAVLRNRLGAILQQHRRTMYGRWSVCQIKEGLRVGLIGSWANPFEEAR